MWNNRDYVQTYPRYSWREVPFLEAIRAWAEDYKQIKCELSIQEEDGTITEQLRYKPSIPPLRQITRDEATKGKWYIQEPVFEPERMLDYDDIPDHIIQVEEDK